MLLYGDVVQTCPWVFCSRLCVAVQCLPRLVGKQTNPWVAFAEALIMTPQRVDSSFLFFQQASPQRQAVLAQSSGSLVVTYRPVAFLGKCACLAVHSLNVFSVLLQVCWLLTSPLNIKHQQISNRCTEKHIALPCSGDAVHLHYLPPPSPLVSSPPTQK